MFPQQAFLQSEIFAIHHNIYEYIYICYMLYILYVIPVPIILPWYDHEIIKVPWCDLSSYISSVRC